MLFLVIIISFLTGMITTLLIQWRIIQKYVFTDEKKTTEMPKPEVKRCSLPDELKDVIQNEDYKNKIESWLSINIIMQFLYKEWKDTPKIRSFLRKKITLEFEELLQNTTAGKFLESITVKDLSLGSKCPVLKNIKVMNVVLHPLHDHIKELDIEMQVDYSGGCELYVEADSVVGKSAALAVKLIQLEGTARFQLTQDPYSYWSFSFIEPPVTKFEVKSQLIPQVTSLIIAQIRRVLKKRHTLPQYKIRYQPFCLTPAMRHPKALSPEDFEVKGCKLSHGYLCVNVIECSRLTETPANSFLYCSLAIDSSAWVELVSSQYSSWVTQDIEINKGPNQVTGILLKQEFILDKYDHFVVVETIVPNSPASTVDIKKNDVLVSIGGIKAMTVTHAVKLFKQAGDKFVIRLERKSNLRCSHSQEFLNKEVKVNEEILSIKDEDCSQGEEDEEFISYTLKDSTDSPKKAAVSLHKQLFHKKRDESVHSPKLSKKKMEENDTSVKKSEDTSSVKSVSRHRAHSDSLSTADNDSTGSAGTESDKSSEFGFLGSDIDLQKTTLVKSSTDPVWEEKFEFLVTDKHRYLNLGIWNKPRERKQERLHYKPERDTLLGYMSISLADIALECAATFSGSYQQSYAFMPPEPKAIASRDHKLSQHSGFNQKLCHGDITLLFVHRPEGDEWENMDSDDDVDVATASKKMDEMELVDSANRNENKQFHDFIGAHFHASTICDFCHKKIWLKTAFQCRNCAMICHKKCADKCRTHTICLQSTVDGPPPSDSVKVTLSAANCPDIVTTVLGSEEVPFDTVLVRTPGQDGQSINVFESNYENEMQCSLQENPFILMHKDDDIEAAIERVLQHHPQDEMLVSSAKELGKELYANLPLGQRKIKLNLMIAKLQSEISDEDKRRVDLLLEDKETTDLAAKTKIALLVNQSDKKIQALAVLMLHYFAGLQHCIELEKSAPTDLGEDQVDQLDKDKVSLEVNGTVEEVVANDVNLDELIDFESVAHKME